ncbi:MAG TPA: coenzyme F420-0:L-glutamate ligase [Methylomirabilota bacterium]|jgi:coenzyme F420-0:L-glutamate ligase/coenzyme F420-1:gamma-L-glutamate ligase|nr:coenzyme F420-0:L-glutamate ligase [Methylomirabilota bacterium]
MRVTVVPAKELGAAKQRLGDAVPAPARAALARAMLEDVLAALTASPVDRIIVVTPDADVADVAARWGADVLREPASEGHTAAVARGVRACRELGATVMLTVPGDLPCLTAAEVARILDACPPAPGAVFVASRSGAGTNAACLAPPDAMPLRFGEPSFEAHLAVARAHGLEPVVLALPGAALDVDRPEDLELLRTLGPDTRAAAVLRAASTPPAARAARLEIHGVHGLPELRAGDDLAEAVLAALAAQGTPLAPGDVVVLSQKAVSKVEGRLVPLADVVPSPFAVEVARAQKKDPRLIELILRESRRVVRMDRGVLITETRQGQICANAGVDQSNVGLGWASLLPEDPDASARAFAERVRAATGIEIAVIVADTFGRPWREGLVNVAIGVAGLRPLQSYLGVPDAHGYTLQATILAVADELAGAAELVMGKLDQVPVAIVRGYRYDAGPGSARELLRDPNLDLFR